MGRHRKPDGKEPAPEDSGALSVEALSRKAAGFDGVETDSGTGPTAGVDAAHQGADHDLDETVLEAVRVVHGPLRVPGRPALARRRVETQGRARVDVRRAEQHLLALQAGVQAAPAAAAVTLATIDQKRIETLKEPLRDTHKELVIDTLKERAKRKGHSLEQELREALTAAARLTVEEKLELSRRIRAMTFCSRAFATR